MTSSATFPITFRLAQDNDLPAIIDIWRENIIKEYRMDTASLQTCSNTLSELFKTRDGHVNFWVAISSETHEVIGWNSFVSILPTVLKRNTAVEISTYIKPDYQSNGVAFKLMAYCLAELTGSHISFVYGFANASKLKIHKILNRLGFEQCGKLPATGEFPYTESKLLFIYQTRMWKNNLMSFNGGGGSNIIVRLAKPADVPALQHLLNSHLYENMTANERAQQGGFVRVNYSGADFKTMIEQQEIVVADCEHAVVGYYLIGHSCANEQLQYQREAMEKYTLDGLTLTDPRIACGDQAVVTTAYRGLGLTGKMLAVLATSIQDNYTHLFSSITKSNQNAFTVHANSGYTIVGEDSERHYVLLKLNNQ